MQSCTRCILDTTVETIRFDANGVCNFCHAQDRLMQGYLPGPELERRLSQWVDAARADGKGKDYDCVVGVSGGTDSTYTLLLSKKLGLRPLAVHFDNGWNTDESVTNIKRATDKLNVDLVTYVVDWEEFKDLQLSFLKASVPCIEAPSDVGIHGTLLRTAEKEKLKYILGGQSFKTEGTVPREWSYLDPTYIRSVHKQFGTVKLKSFPNLSMSGVAYYTFLKGIKQVPILNYVDYDKTRAKKELAEALDWRDYGGHHYENIYSKFAFGWYQYRKFNIDKRKVTYSGQVRSGLITREQALEKIKETPAVEQSVVDYVVKKLGLTFEEFREYYDRAPKFYYDYYTSASFLKYFKLPMKLAVKMKFFTPVLYEKYFEEA